MNPDSIVEMGMAKAGVKNTTLLKMLELVVKCARHLC